MIKVYIFNILLALNFIDYPFLRLLHVKYTFYKNLPLEY